MDKNERIDPFYSDGVWMVVSMPFRHFWTGEPVPYPLDHPVQYVGFPMNRQYSPHRLLQDKYGKPRFYD